VTMKLKPKKEAFVRALDKALGILEHLSRVPVEIDLATLAKQTGMPKSTLLRLLNTLKSHNLLAKIITRGDISWLGSHLSWKGCSPILQPTRHCASLSRTVGHRNGGNSIPGGFEQRPRHLPRPSDERQSHQRYSICWFETGTPLHVCWESSPGWIFAEGFSAFSKNLRIGEKNRQNDN